MSKCVVVGGGAAGMMAAYQAAALGQKVLLIEKNEKLGKKVYITGKGRCNLTNACETEDFFQSVVTNPRFLYSAVYGFGPRDMMELLEQYGCKTKVERGLRVFPVSDHASDVIFAMQRAMQAAGVEVRLNTKVKRVLVRDGAAAGVELSGGGRLTADRVIVCTGGVSYPSTGSTGDGYRFAFETGLAVTERRPALVPLICRENWCKDLMGLSLKNVRVALYAGSNSAGSREIFQDFGEMLFTHFGVSGPLILSASSFLERWLSDGAGRRKGRPIADNADRRDDRKSSESAGSQDDRQIPEGVTLFIDLKPALTMDQLDKRLLREFEDNKNKQFKNALDSLFPAKLIPVMVSLSGIHPEKKVHEITREERLGFAALIKALPLTVTGTGDFNEAIITQGGVDVREINPSTMESRKIKGLYFAGEVLDVDALTGGFNLQIAWSTGYLAGSSAE
ncbi:MAG: NAD(P)/FAD-dependent oxidoreductase [Lachnospiraceae bacterium]|nr:NAD(P)/FAD-dependent oxidoreductase [Lachnospiraceae bacterium]